MACNGAAMLPSGITLRHRKLGAGAFAPITLQRVAPGRGWYTGSVPLTAAAELGSADFEYTVEATLAGGGAALACPERGHGDAAVSQCSFSVNHLRLTANESVGYGQKCFVLLGDRTTAPLEV